MPRYRANPVSALAADHPLSGLADSTYLLAANSSSDNSSGNNASDKASRAPVRTPVWFQRQAGRSLPEYRSLRSDGSILEAIKNPELAAEITLQPVRRYGVDAAVLFSDIIVPVAGVGFGMEIKPGVGPVADRPFESRADLERLQPLVPDQHVPYVAETVKLATQMLASEGLNVPLIGFAGAPFTVASYLVEGKPSRDQARTKQLMLNDPALWHDLMSRLTDIAVQSMRSQVMAGASAVQLFDTWAGALTPNDYTEFVLPHSRRVFAELADLAAEGVPRAHFGVNTGELLGLMASVDCEVVGVDWRVPLEVAAQKIMAHKGGATRGTQPAQSQPAQSQPAQYQSVQCQTLQGNLDPAACLAPWPVVRERVDQVLASASTLPGHIFNLGHGVLPQTDPAILEQVVRHVHDQTESSVARPGSA